MSAPPVRSPSDAPRTRFGEVFAAWGLSYVLMFGLLALLVHQSGIWNLLATTRLMDLFIEGGLIKYHDMHHGFVEGIPDLEKYVMAKDPIDGRLVLIAFVIYFFYWGVKALLFHGVGRTAGMSGTARQHGRAWLYGEGVGRFCPLRFGDAATETALESEGEESEKVTHAFDTMAFLTVVFQIGLFWFFGLFVTSYDVWFEQSFWALVILGLSFLIARRTGLVSWEGRGFWNVTKATYRRLAENPGRFLRLGSLAAFVMLLDDITPFVVAMAFTSDHVILSLPFFLIQSGVVAGYIATRYPITPHGIGQWEWAFTMALVVSGVGMPEAATIALIDSVIRHTTGTIIFLIVRLGPGIKVGFKDVMARYAAPRPEPDPAGGTDADVPPAAAAAEASA